MFSSHRRPATRGPDYRALAPRALPRRFRRPRVLIVGFGDVGARLAGRLTDRWTVYAVCRSEAGQATARRNGAQALAPPPPGSAADRRRWSALAGRILYAAPPPADAGAVDPLLRAWLRRLLRPPSARSSIASWSPTRVCYLSTTGVYGDQQGRWIDETCPPAPLSARARRRCDAERQLREAAGRLQLHAQVLRVPGIYAIDRLPIQRLRDAVPVPVADDATYTNHIQADDLAAAALLALLRGRTQRTTQIVDDSDLTISDYMDAVARWADLPAPPRLPRAALLEAVGPARASFLRESRRLRNARMRNELRVRLRWPTVSTFLAGHDPALALRPNHTAGL